MEFTGATACTTSQHLAHLKAYVLRTTDITFTLHSVALVLSQSQQNVTTVRPPRAVARLTSSRVEALKPTKARYEIGDTEVRGLQLRVAPTGVKSWHWRFYWQGEQVALALGALPESRLANAHAQEGRAAGAR